MENIDSEKPKRIVKGTSPYEDKIIAIFKQSKKSSTVRIYFGDTKKYATISQTTFREFRKNPRSCKYILIQKDEESIDMKNLDMSQQYEIIYKEAVYLKNLTNGKINRFKTGSVAKTALQLYYDLCIFIEPDQIEEYEAEILEKCYRGGLIFGIKYKGKGFKYDIVSEYPSIMISKNAKFPIGRGELQTFTKEEFDKLLFYKYGIYHVKVINADHRLFKTNKNNWYTHTDLNYAKNHLHCILELIEDEKPNGLIYNNLKVAKTMFEPFINYLFEFKKNGVKEIKKYMNALAGVLCQKNELEINNNIIHDNKTVCMALPKCNDLKKPTDCTFTVYNKKKQYETNFARMHVFLVSAGRLMISNMIKQNLNSVVRCYVDGIILNKPIENVKLGNEIGNLKFEGSGNCEILNARDYTFNFDNEKA
jgi:hypothetical protein